MRPVEETLERRPQGSKRTPLRQFTATSTILSVALLLLPAHTSPGADGLSLELAYVLRMPRGWSGNLDGLLDPEGRFLFIVETGDWGVRVSKVDWRNERTDKRKTYPGSACNWDLASRWSWIPHTRFIELKFCGVHYVIDAESLEIKHNMQAKRYGEGFVFAPTGTMVLVSEYDEEKKNFRKALHEFPSWAEIAPWRSRGQDERFTHDGRYIIAKLIRSDPHRGVVAECGLAFYEVPTGKLATKWLVDPQEEEYCGGGSTTLLPNLAYLAVDRVLARGLVVADLWTGKVLYDLEAADVSIQTIPSLSPDGRLVVVGGWDDPEDNQWSRDFVIWDLRTRKVVYQAERYRSVWGRNTHGREVYPRFSNDGKYLIAVEEHGIELYRIIPGGDRAEISNQHPRLCLLKFVAPVYPQICRRSLIAGSVRARVQLDQEGIPAQIDFLEGNPLLQQSTVESVRKWQFCNASLLEQDRFATIEVDFDFVLEGEPSDYWSPTKVQFESPARVSITTTPASGVDHPWVKRPPAAVHPLRDESDCWVCERGAEQGVHLFRVGAARHHRGSDHHVPPSGSSLGASEHQHLGNYRGSAGELPVWGGVV